MNKQERIEKAVALFKEGYNCSQSVVAAYADLYGFTPEQALRMAASFGGGIGRMREICGAACGMFLLAGLERSAVSGADRESKAANYALVQELAAKFKEVPFLHEESFIRVVQKVVQQMVRGEQVVRNVGTCVDIRVHA